ncbi:MAG: hypothetical protein ACREXP_20370 [Steroidobacteraceae bacterium]
MVIVIVRHGVKPGMMEIAQERIDANGGRMARTPGLVFRYALRAASDAYDIVTITAWESGL